MQIEFYCVRNMCTNRPAGPRLDDAFLTARHGHSFMQPVIAVSDLKKTYASGFQALKGINLNIRRGEIFALLGPNGAGKTTLINIICGIVNPTSGSVKVDGHHFINDYRAARSLIGLVPQELTTDAFESVWATVSFSRSLFGKPRSAAHIEKVLKDLTLWDRKDHKIMTLSGGMKRRVMIAKALSHEPNILFLDEPTAGVDVELRIELWGLLRELNAAGTTIILTTHYLEEAELLCRNIAIIEGGRIVAKESTADLLARQGNTTLSVTVDRPLARIPVSFAARGARYDAPTNTLHVEGLEPSAIAPALTELEAAGYTIANVDFKRASLQDVFLELVRR